MKIKRFLILLLLNLWLFGDLNAQEIEIDKPKKEVYLKAYVNFLYFNSNYNPRSYGFVNEFFRFWGVTPAISFREKESRKIHEFEPKFWYSIRDNDNIEEYEVGMRYELCWYLKKEILSGMRFRWGPSTRIYYYHADITSGSNGFPAKAQNGGFEFSLAAHLEYQISKNIKIELTTSNFNINFAIDNQCVENPALTRNQKNQGGFDFAFFDQRILRIGIGYEL